MGDLHHTIAGLMVFQCGGGLVNGQRNGCCEVANYQHKMICIAMVDCMRQHVVSLF